MKEDREYGQTASSHEGSERKSSWIGRPTRGHGVPGLETNGTRTDRSAKEES